MMERLLDRDRDPELSVKVFRNKADITGFNLTCLLSMTCDDQHNGWSK